MPVVVRLRLFGRDRVIQHILSLRAVRLQKFGLDRVNLLTRSLRVVDQLILS
jgi:hypothetical protein